MYFVAHSSVLIAWFDLCLILKFEWSMQRKEMHKSNVFGSVHDWLEMIVLSQNFVLKCNTYRHEDSWMLIPITLLAFWMFLNVQCAKSKLTKQNLLHVHCHSGSAICSSNLKHDMRVFIAQVDQTIRKPMGVRWDTEHEAYDQNQMYPTYHQFALYISDQRIYFVDL